ncbi:MAG: DegV family protein, partial [Chloroflexota bacterium]|nr:DegV family protein [Chloroflexota bacterium]
KTRTRPLAIKRLVEIMEEKAGLNRLHINLMHANAWEEAQKLKRQITTRFDCAELHVTEFSSVMGVHTGPGLVGLAFHNEEAL